jgi:hypothetical protein
MSTTLNDTMDTAKNVLDSARETTEHAVGTARHAMGSARDSTGHAVSGARSTLLDGVKTVSGIVAMLRDLGVSDALGWVGLSRRRSPLLSVAIFGAGVAVGAGAGLMFAQTSGTDLRRAILVRLMGPMDAAKETVTKDAHAVSEGAAAVKEVVVNHVEAAAHVVKEAATAHGTPGNGHRPA